jgi:hypothetical protein
MERRSVGSLALVLAAWVGCGEGDVTSEADGLVEEARSRTKQAARESPPGFEYTEDFEGRVGPEWSRRGTEETPAGRRFLGRFRQQSVRLKLGRLPNHDTVRLSFDLYVIGSWDGNSPLSGPDRWRLRVKDGPTLVDTTFSNDVWGAGATREYFQAFPGRSPGAAYPGLVNAFERGTLGYPDTSTYGGVGDSVYRLNFQFRHSEDDVELVFEDLPRSEADESWGLDNVRVTLGSDDERGGTRWLRLPSVMGSSPRAASCSSSTAMTGGRAGLGPLEERAPSCPESWRWRAMATSSSPAGSPGTWTWGTVSSPHRSPERR